MNLGSKIVAVGKIFHFSCPSRKCASAFFCKQSFIISMPRTSAEFIRYFLDIITMGITSEINDSEELIVSVMSLNGLNRIKIFLISVH